MADTAALKELAPTGKLRLAIAVAPSPSAQFAVKDGDSYRGVAVTFGRALSAKLGVPLEIIPHQASGEIQNSSSANRWDVAFLPVDEERKKFVDFGNAYHLLQSTFLVPAGSKIKSVKDANAKGVGIGGVANTATFRAARKATPAPRATSHGHHCATARSMRLRSRASRYPVWQERFPARAFSMTRSSIRVRPSACPRASRRHLRL